MGITAANRYPITWFENGPIETAPAKSNGQGIADPLWWRRERVRDLVRFAITEDTFVVGFEPIFGVNGTLVSLMGFESLSEWGSDEIGYFHPLEVLMVAVEEGLIEHVTEALLRTTMQRASHPSNVFDITFNLTLEQLIQPNLISTIERIAEQTGFSLSRLIIEISEKYREEDLSIMRKRIEQLRRLGIRIALDDFGTFAAGLNSLCQFPLDIVKVDMSLFHRHRTVPSQGVVLEGIVDMCRRLKLTCIVEGVETAEDFEIAKKCGFQGFQGYFFGRRLRIEKLEMSDIAGRTYPAGLIEHQTIN